MGGTSGSVINEIKGVMMDRCNYAIEHLSNGYKFYIFSKEESYPENCIEVFYEKEEYIISRKNRNERRIIISTKAEEVVIVSVCVASLDFITSFNSDGVSILRNGVRDKGIEFGEKFLSDRLDTSLYSLYKEDSNKISLIINGVQADVLYKGYYLVKDGSISRCFAAVYNYCRKLIYLKSFIKELREKLGFEIDYDYCCKIYIVGGN